MNSGAEAASADRGIANFRSGFDRRWSALRNSLYASATFRRWATRFPLTRRVARRHASDLFDLCAGFVYSQILFACVRLRLFDALEREPKSFDELARLTRIPAHRLERLLEAAASLGLLEAGTDSTFRLGPRGALIAAQPALRAMIAHHWMFYEDLRDPVALLAGDGEPTRLREFWCYANGRPDAAAPHDDAEPYSALMTATRALFAEEVLHAYDFRRHRRILDVGGGEAMWAIELAQRYPTLSITVFDLPPVAARADARIDAFDMRARIRAVGGDFRCDDLPQGADLVTLNRVLHDHDDDIALRLLSAACRALAPGGTVMVAEPMQEHGARARVGSAYFNFYFLAMGSGRPRSPAGIRQLMEGAGLSHVRRHATSQPLCASIITATRKL